LGGNCFQIYFNRFYSPLHLSFTYIKGLIFNIKLSTKSRCNFFRKKQLSRNLVENYIFIFRKKSRLAFSNYFCFFVISRSQGHQLYTGGVKMHLDVNLDDCILRCPPFTFPLSPFLFSFSPFSPIGEKTQTLLCFIITHLVICLST